MPHHPMTKGEIALLRTSYAPVAKDFKGAGLLFYQTLFADYPHLKKDFVGVNQEVQAERVMRFVNSALSLLDEPEDLEFSLICCGERHSGYGTAPASYPLVGANLLKILKIALGDAFTPETEAAWKKFYDYMAEVMIKGQTTLTGQELHMRWQKKQEKSFYHSAPFVIGFHAVVFCAIGAMHYMRRCHY